MRFDSESPPFNRRPQKRSFLVYCISVECYSFKRDFDCRVSGGFDIKCRKFDMSVGRLSGIFF